LLLGAWFLVAVAELPGFGYADVRQWLNRPTSSVLMVLLITSIAWHSDLGIRVVIEDYVHQPFFKVASMVIVRFLHAALVAASIFAVLRMALT
jgi:succinate dehydrogenase / fumarate reductase membrane anchor subunit